MVDRGSKPGVLDPYEWVNRPEWSSQTPDERVDFLRDACERKEAWIPPRGAAPEVDAQLEALVGALAVFLEAIQPVRRVYEMTGLPVLKDICHAIFGWDVLLSLTVNNERSRRILLLGETGVGKERVGTLIGKTLRHLHGTADGTDVSISAANFGGDTLRSELFGHEKDAFTGARDRHPGILGALAPGDSLFIDEIGEASLTVQTLLLRAIQEKGTFRAMGATTSKPTKRFHLVAATNRKERELRSGEAFRSDLYYRLAQPQLCLPALRDILNAARNPHRIFKGVVDRVIDEDLKLGPHAYLLDKLKVESLGKRLARATADTGYTWPGNFRELRNVIHQLIYSGVDQTTAVVVRLQAGQGIDEAAAAVAQSEATSERPPTLAELKRAAYEQACSRNHTVTAVARELDVSRQTAHERIKGYGLSLRTD